MSIHTSVFSNTPEACFFFSAALRLTVWAQRWGSCEQANGFIFILKKHSIG